MIITRIEKQKNNKKRYSIFIDYEFAFGIDEIDLIYYKIKDGEELDGEKYDYIMKKLLLKRAKDKALKYLAYKMRSKLQVIKRLEEYEFPNEVILKVIKVLEKYNYINDDDFSKAFINDKLKLKGHGLFKIQYELRTLGIEKNIYEKYIDYDMEIEKATQLLEKKLKGDLELDFIEKRKLCNYLARRGFSYDCIDIAFKKIFGGF